ncbi:MAG: ABC transporter permease [Chloroflexi bacterium]|nr:ABC transporter permease [Chloroflexota bacterium]
MIRWDVLDSNLPLILDKIAEHLALTVVAVVVGFVLSFFVVIGIRGRRRLVGPTLGFFGLLYTIPSLALLAFLVPITRLSFLTAEIALVSYTLLVLARNLLAGLDGVPRDVLEAADGMGYSHARRLWQVELPLALPLIVAGIRLTTVTTIGLVMVTALIGFGGLGQVMLRGYNFRSDTLVVAGFVLTVAMALAADLALGWLGRAITPWSRARGLR